MPPKNDSTAHAPKRIRAPKKKQEEEVPTELIENDSRIVLNDPYSPFRTVMLMRNLSLFLIQEGYDFPLPEKPV